MKFRIDISPKETAISALSALGLAVIIVWFAFPYLGSGQCYPDITVGRLTWTDYDKDREWRVLYMLIALTHVLGGAMACFFWWLRRNHLSSELTKRIYYLLVVAWVPGMFALGGSLVNRVPERGILGLSLLLVPLTVLVAVLLVKKHPLITPDHCCQIGLSAILLVSLAPFIAFSCVTFVGKVACAHADPDRFLFPYWLVAISCVSVLAVLLTLLLSKSSSKARDCLYTFMIALQSFFPLLLFRLISQSYWHRQKLHTFQRSWSLAIVIGALVLLAWYSLWRRFRHMRRASSRGEAVSVTSVLSPFALYPIAIYVACNFYYGYAFSTDHFHLGEQLLPYHQLMSYGSIPYVDFAPIHGLMSYSSGALNELFYSGTVATFGLSVCLTKAVAVGLTFLAIHCFSGPLLALSVTPFVCAFDRFYFLVAALLLFCNSRALGRSRLWLCLWFGVMPLLVLYNIPMGVGVLAGTLPIAASTYWRTAKAYPRWSRRFFLVLCVSASLLLAVNPIRKMVVGLARFVIDNAAINTVANGIGLFQTATSLDCSLGYPANPFQFSVLKLAWLLVAFYFYVLFIVLKLAKSHKTSDAARTIYPLACALPLTLVTVGAYALTRIDLSALSRTGWLSFSTALVFVPVLIFRSASTSFDIKRLVAVTLFVGFVVNLGGGVDLNKWKDNPLGHQHMGAHCRLFSGSDVGLPRLGTGIYDPGRVSEIRALRRAIAPYMRPGETFLDLTNRSAFYYYLDLVVPVLYASDYVAANTASLVRIIEQLCEHPPAIVLISPRLQLDGVPVSLRGYALYRQLVDAYIPKEIGEFIFLVRPDLCEMPDADSERSLELLDKAFSLTDLQCIPAAWGRSWPVLGERFRTILTHEGKPHGLHNVREVACAEYRPTGPDPWFVYGLGDSGITGSETDFLLIDYSCKSIDEQNTPVIEIYWETEHDEMSEKTVVRFKASGSPALVPVGAQPRWRTAKEIRALRIDVVDYRSFSRLRVNKIQYLELRDQAPRLARCVMARN